MWKETRVEKERKWLKEEVKAVSAKLHRKGEVSFGKILWQNVWKLLRWRPGTGRSCALCPGLRGTLSAGSQASTLDQA